MAKQAAVIGWPVSHSLSPKLHNRWLHQYGIDGQYGALAIKESELASTFRELPSRGYVGWNVTVPHKEQALQLVQETDAAAQAMGAVNTVIVRKDGSLFGTNTDAQGFYHNLRVKAPGRGTRALVIGAGGAARAVLYALKNFAQYNEIHIANRTTERAEQLAQPYGARVAEWKIMEKLLPNIDLLVNTTTLGMEGQPALTLSLKHMNPRGVVYDIVYKPLETPLIKEAKRYKIHTVTGLGMLIYQAVPAFEAWFGVRPEVTPELEAWLLA